MKPFALLLVFAPVVCEVSPEVALVLPVGFVDKNASGFEEEAVCVDGEEAPGRLTDKDPN